jgi:hypothetical protein
MHAIEYDGAEPAPWKVTTDDDSEWHAPSERDAAAQLLEWITQREDTMQRLPERVGAAVSQRKIFLYLVIEVVDGEVYRLVRKKKRPASTWAAWRGHGSRWYSGTAWRTLRAPSRRPSGSRTVASPPLPRSGGRRSLISPSRT